MRKFSDLRIGEFFVVYEVGALMTCYKKKSLSSAYMVNAEAMQPSEKVHKFSGAVRVYLLEVR